VDGCMLAVDGQQTSPATGREPHHQRPRRDERFLVGEGYRFSGIERRPGAAQACRPHDRGHDPVDLRTGHQLVEGRRPHRQAGPGGDVGGGDGRRRCLVDDHEPCGPEPSRLLQERAHAPVGGEQVAGETTAASGNHLEGVGADTAGRPEDGDIETAPRARFRDRHIHQRRRRSGDRAFGRDHEMLPKGPRPHRDGRMSASSVPQGPGRSAPNGPREWEESGLATMLTGRGGPAETGRPTCRERERFHRASAKFADHDRASRMGSGPSPGTENTREHHAEET